MTLTPATDLGIRRTDVSDTPAVAATVAAAFFDDPVTRWLLPDEHRRQRVIQPIFELYVAPYARLGETYVTADGNGAAVWLPPGTQLLTAEEEQSFGDALERADGEHMPAYHEATSPRNRGLYERHGYVTQGEFTLPEGPPLWRMWRDPR